MNMDKEQSFKLKNCMGSLGMSGITFISFSHKFHSSLDLGPAYASHIISDIQFGFANISVECER